MPDPHRIKGELQAVLSRPEFSSMSFHRNQFAKPGSAANTPETIATQTANYLWEKKPLLDPVEVVVLRGPLELYRAYDGGVRKGSAGTLGRSWFERSVAEAIWKATDKYKNDDRQKWYMEFLRTANFVLPNGTICGRLPTWLFLPGRAWSLYAAGAIGGQCARRQGRRGLAGLRASLLRLT